MFHAEVLAEAYRLQAQMAALRLSLDTVLDTAKAAVEARQQVGGIKECQNWKE